MTCNLCGGDTNMFNPVVFCKRINNPNCAVYIEQRPTRPFDIDQPRFDYTLLPELKELKPYVGKYRLDE